jgi:CheY-like chemotaxis protein
LLPQVILNLITNASEAIGEHQGVITIRTGLRTLDAEILASSHIGGELPPGEYVAIQVSDTGGGMTDDALARVFDPFFTTKDKGLGLGLAAVHGIAKDHGAVIHATSTLGRGSTFSICFHPSAETPRTQSEPPFSPDAALRGTGVILVVDNEEPIRRLARIVLEHAGFTVLTANDGVEAIEVFQQHASTIRAVVLDLTMPRMDGATALRELQRLREDLPVVLSSGFIAQKAARDLTAGQLVGFIQKPYHSRDLVEAVCRAVAGGASGRVEQ